MDRVDDSYAAVIAARRHERAFDKFLAEPFLEAVAQGAAECYEANRVQIEALEPDQQRHQRGELRRRWLVAVIKYTPLQLDSFVRRAEFERDMDLRALKAIAESRKLPSVSAATEGQPAATGESAGARAFHENPSGSADPMPPPVTLDETEKLLRAALSAGDQPAIEKALAELWGPGWSQNACAHEAGVDPGTIRNMIRGNNLRDSTWIRIVEAFKKRRTL